MKHLPKCSLPVCCLLAVASLLRGGLLCTVGFLLTCGAAFGAIVTSPYTTNVDEYPLGAVGASNTDFAPTAGGTGGIRTATVVDVGGGDRVMQVVVTNSGLNQTANISLGLTTSPSVVGSNWTMSTSFVLADFAVGTTGSTLNFLLGALGSDGDFASGSSSAYRLIYTLNSANASDNNKLSIGQLGAGPITQVNSTGTLAPVEGRTYTMTLIGTYTGSAIALAGSITDGFGTITINANDSSAATGQNFGIRAALSAAGVGTSTETINMTSFSVVPEPGVGGLLALSLGALMRRRHRR